MPIRTQVYIDLYRYGKRNVSHPAEGKVNQPKRTSDAGFNQRSWTLAVLVPVVVAQILELKHEGILNSNARKQQYSPNYNRSAAIYTRV
jgi:hypothetical protein